jgi:hypothetical protein
MPFMKALLQNHSGLEFLEAHPDFHEKYSDIVILRIFYNCDTNDEGKLKYKRSENPNF